MGQSETINYPKDVRTWASVVKKNRTTGDITRPGPKPIQSASKFNFDHFLGLRIIWFVHNLYHSSLCELSNVKQGTTKRTQKDRFLPLSLRNSRSRRTSNKIHNGMPTLIRSVNSPIIERHAAVLRTKLFLYPSVHL